MGRPLLYAIAVCAVAAAGEAVFMGKNGGRFMKSLKQPAFAPPLWGWSLIGVGYYAICFLAVFRLASDPRADRLAIALVLALLETDVVSAFAFGAYVLYLPYALLLFYRTWKLNV